MIRIQLTALQLFAALLVALLLLVQGELLAHETEHAVQGENNSCISCWIADHQHFTSTEINNIDLPCYPDSYIKHPVNFSYPDTHQLYSNRDPPL